MDKIEELLEDIKKLMIVQLVTSGAQAKDIADVLGVDRSVIARIAPAKKFKREPLRQAL
jgi:hypothetical protein